MDLGQILQVVLSLGVVALALFLSARVARRRLGPGGEEAMRVLARQSVSRTQNLIVVEANGHRHLLALTDGGAHTVQTWDAPAPETARSATGPKHAAPRSPSPAALPALPALSARPVAALARPVLARLRLRPGTGASRGTGSGLDSGGARHSASHAVPQRQDVPAGTVATELASGGSAAGVSGRGDGGSTEPTPVTGNGFPTGRNSFAAKLAAVQARTQWAPLGRQDFAGAARAGAAATDAPASKAGDTTQKPDSSAAHPAPDAPAPGILAAAGGHRP